MTFKEWLFSSYPNPRISGQWGMVHIITLLISIATIVVLALLLRGNSPKKEKARRIAILVLAGLIFFFEMSRRIINLCKTTDYSTDSILYILLPRPWCAISCWVLMISAVVNKKFFYNFASITALLNALIFFSYPSAGVNNKYILYENLYSIGTHALLLITSVSLITLGFVDYKYKTIWKELVCFAVIYIYSIFEILIGVSDDPLYYRAGNEVHEILGVSYPLYVILYVIFMIIYVNIFYLIKERKLVLKGNKKQIAE